MTRNDTVLIARAIVAIRNSINEKYEHKGVTDTTLDDLANELAWQLKNNDEGFDRARFIAACCVSQ